MSEILLQTLNQWSRRIWRQATGSFARNVVLITSGAAVAQLLTLLSAPLLTRLFTPEAFGLLGLFTATVGLLSSSANLRYELPIVIARTLPQATALLYLCLLITTAFTGLMSIAILLWGRPLAEMLDTPQLVPYLPWLPIHIFATGVFLAFSQWITRQREFALLARNPVIRSGATVVVQLAAGIMAFGQGWLIVGFITGQIAAALSVTSRLKRRYWKALRPRVVLGRRMAAVARRFRCFPQFSAPQEAVNAASQQMPNFILAAFFGPATVGIYWLTLRAFPMPANFIGQGGGRVFFRRICEIINRGDRAVVPMTKATFGLLALGFPVFLPTIFFGPFFFAFIFGEPWREAGEMARWVALWAWFGFANVPTFCCLQAMGAQQELLIYEILLFIARNSVLFLFAYNGNPLQAIAAYALTGMTFNAGLIGYGLLLAMKNGKEHFRTNS